MNALDPRSVGVDRVVESQWPVEQRAINLSTLRHDHKCGSFQGRRQLGRDSFNRRQQRYLRTVDAQGVQHLDRIATDVSLVLQAGKDVYRRVGNEQRFVVAGHTHGEDMAEAPLSAQTAFTIGHGMQQFIAVQAAFHQQLATTFADQGNTTLGGSVTVWHVLHG